MNQKQLGRYELIRVLGKGAMGLVYEGRDPNLDRRVAIKTIKVENLGSEEAAEYEVRFRIEARSAARLQHPNIVSVYDSDRDGDVAYLVMEYIQGRDLKHHLDQGVRYTLRQAASIMNDLLAALDYAHRQNIVHRDIKPANLLIEADGRIKLTDFGVARIQDAGEATRTKGTMVGTLKYMSPEQLQGLPVDARSDLFSAAVVLYQLLTGTRPFDGGSDYDIMQMIIAQEPTAPSIIHPHLPPAVDVVIRRALAKSRDARYASAQEFNAALQAAIDSAADATITAPRSTPGGADSATWTSTVIKGESLVSTSSGSVPGSTVTQEVELVYWKDIKDSTEIEDFQNYLLKFPSGIYVDLARRRIKRLQQPDAPTGGSHSGTRPDIALPDGPDDETARAPAPVAAASARKRSWLLPGAAVAVLAVAVLGYLGLRSPAPPPQATAATAAPAPVADAAPPPRDTATHTPVDARPARPLLRPRPAQSPPEASPTPAVVAGAKTVRDPEQACAGRVFLALQNCLKRECSKPDYAPHPVCVQRKAMEDNNLLSR